MSEEDPGDSEPMEQESRGSRATSRATSRAASRGASRMSKTSKTSKLDSVYTTQEDINEEESHEHISVEASLSEVGSDIVVQLKAADEQAALITEAIKELKDTIAELSKKRDLSPADQRLLAQKKDELMIKLDEFEELTKNVQYLMGMKEVSSSELSNIFRTRPQKVGKLPKKCVTDSFENFCPSKLPKVIVCGTGKPDQVPKIIVCEPAEKGGNQVYQQTRARPCCAAPQPCPSQPPNQPFPPAPQPYRPY